MTAAQARPAGSEPEPVPEPIAGTKLAWLRAGPAGPRFHGVGWPDSLPYGPVDEARCARTDHPVTEPVPSVLCTCGFHALDSVRRVETQLGPRHHDAVRLDVELTGRVLEGSRGWRAQEQSVLGVHVSRTCSCCSRQTAELGARRIGGVLRPLCARHARRAHVHYGIADVAGRLGVEVSADEGPPSEERTRGAAIYTCWIAVFAILAVRLLTVVEGTVTVVAMIGMMLAALLGTIAFRRARAFPVGHRVRTRVAIGLTTLTMLVAITVVGAVRPDLPAPHAGDSGVGPPAGASR